MAPVATPHTSTEDGRQGGRIQNYTKFWQKDISKEADVDNQNRVESYTDVVNGMFSPFLLGSFLILLSRLLRWSNRALRVWLGEILPFLTVLQRRSVCGLSGSSRALPRCKDVPQPWHESP
jgi:hypothetical protein